MRRIRARSWLRAVLPLLLAVWVAMAAPVSVAAQAAAAAPEPGYQLLAPPGGDAWGVLTEPLRALVQETLNLTGLSSAAQAATSALNALGQGKVPVITDLQDPFRGNVESTVQDALDQADLATLILGNVATAGEGAKAAFEALAKDPLLPDGELAFTLPSGRVRLTKAGTDLSLCLTVIGPAGSRVTSGISNADPLCGTPGERFTNHDNPLIAFTDLAVGYTHIQSRLQLAPSLSAPLNTLPPSLTGQTFVPINGQWVKVALTAQDPGSVFLEAEVSVALAGGVQYIGRADLEGNASLTFEVTPALAAEVIQGAAQAMVAAAQAQGAEGLDDHLDPKKAAPVIRAGLLYLEQVKEAHEESGEELGAISLNVGAEGALGLGIWDTSIAGASVTGTMSTSLPLESYLALSASQMEQLLGIGLSMGDATERLSSAILEGKGQTELNQLLSQAGTVATGLVTNVFNDLVEAATDLTVSFEFDMAVAGEGSGTSGGGSGAAQNIPLVQQAVEIPVGAAIETLRDDPNAIVRALEAAARIVTTALGSADGSLADGIDRANAPTPTGDGGLPPVTTAATWHTLSLGMLDQTKLTFMVTGAPLMLTGMEEVPLGEIVELMDKQANRIVPILVGMVEGARTGDLDALRGAIDTAIAAAGGAAEGALIDFLKAYTLPVSTGIGTNFEIGAEGQAELGLGGRLEGRLKASSLLLMANHPAYDEEHGTELFNLSLPMSFSLSGGASVGEGVEFSVGAGGTLGFTLFELSLTHWEGDLPTPASMDVAGFEVIDFVGTVRDDESFTGTGYLVLPMGGIVQGTFDVDSEGHVISGTWEGGFDLGPLGKLTLAQGQIKDDGLHGDLDIQVLESTIKAKYNLQSSGLLFGKYEGNLVVAGRTLANTTVELRQDGYFHGSTFVDVAGSQVKLDLQIGAGRLIGSATTTLVIAGQQVSNLQLTLNGVTLSGQGSFNLLGNSARFDLTVSPTGGVTGSYRQGANEIFGVAGFGLSNVTLTLDQNGFAGAGKLTVPGMTVLDLQDLRITPQGKLTATATSSLDLFGFATATRLTLTETGLTGTGSMQVLGSPLATSDLTIHSGGSVTGNFKGNLTVAGHTLSDTSLQLQNDGLAGTTKMDLPGVAKANLTLILKGGQVSARYDGQITLFGYHATELFLTFLPDKIVVKGALQDDIVEFLDGETRKAVNTLADGARAEINNALAGIRKAQQDIENMDVTIRQAREQAEYERRLAQQAVRDAETALRGALDALDDVLDAIAWAERDFRGKLYEAEQGAIRARVDVNNARWAVADLDRQIRDLENWYNGLNDWDKFWNAVGFGIKWSALQVARTAANEALNIADGVLWIAEESFRQARRDLEATLAPLLDKKNIRQQLYNEASAALSKASQDLQNIPVNTDLHPLVWPQLLAQAALRDTLRLAEQFFLDLNRTLGALPELVDLIDDLGLNQVVNVNTANFETELGALFTGKFSARVNGVFMGQARTIALDLNLADPVGSAASLANAFVSAASADELPPDGSEPEPPADVIAPVTAAAFPVGWQKSSATVSLNAIDNVGGSGVAAIVVGAAGAQPMPQTAIAGAAANIEVTAEGVTTVTYQARDAKGNLEASRSGQVHIDRTAPQATATQPETWLNDRATVQITAADGLSGIASITYAATGAQPMEAVTLGASTVTVQISTPGETIVTYHATDNAGNVSATGTMVVLLDRMAPTTNATAPAGWVNQPATVSITAADEAGGSGVASVTYSATGAQSIAQKTVAGDAATFQVTAEGVTTVTYYATDVAGNAAEPKTITVRIDKTKPQVVAVAPSAWQNQPVVVHFDAHDNADGSGIASITVSASGAENYDPIALPSEITEVEVKTEGITTLTYYTTDAAGNVSQSRTFTVRIDLTKPTAAAEAPTHWVNHPVSVSISAADEAGGSGVASVTYSAEGAQPIAPTTVGGAFTAPEITAEGITTVTYFATDVAGNVGETGTITVRLDLTNPDLSGAPDRAPNHYGWYNLPVTVGWTCADTPSGIDPSGGCPEPVTLPDEGAEQSVTRTARDVAGNTTTVTVSGIHIDMTAPTAAAQAPTHWVNHAINVVLTAADEAGGAGVDTITYSAEGAQPIAQTTVFGDYTAPEITAEGITTITYFATDRAGNVGATGTITVKLDLTTPEISGAPDRAPNHHGWYNAPVTVSWTCFDTPSGIDPNGGCPEPVTLPNAGAGQSVTRTARDVAGNTTDATVSGIHIDLVAPTITFTTPVDGQVFTTDQVLTLDFSAADELSGVDIITATLDGETVIDGQAIDLFDKAGFHTLTVTVVDRAGNVTTKSVTYQVLIKATVVCDPKTLNRTGGGEWITCSVEFPLPYSANQINGASVKLNGTVAAVMGKQGWAVTTAVSGNTTDSDGDGLPERMLKFDRAAVAAALAAGEAVEVTLTGEADGLEFIGTTTIRVVDQEAKKPKK